MKEFGQSLSLGSYKGRIRPKYNHPSFIRAVTDLEQLLESPSCQIIHQGRNRIGTLFLPQKDGKKAEVAIKEFHSRGINRMKSVFLQGKARKAWDGANTLLERGIGTPFPVAYMEKRKNFVLDRSYYLSEKIGGIEEIRSLFRSLPSEGLQNLLSSLASFLLSCHQKGILHRDLSDGNILVEKKNENKHNFYLIDTNRIRIKRRINLLQRIKNLIRLGIPDDAQSIFLSQYLGAPRVKKPFWLWYKTNKRTYSAYVALKKKLRLRQLSQKLRIQ